ncbi:MAG: cytochrome C [Rhodobacteraceae bacterium]|jgi:mono/diheme cytochrome c family protein|uniref:Cytochrome C oxidase, cbb3-type, subunit III n=1 Tax=Salipiger profundus TaxID=1229727 RepID=A0A1U7D6R3_9RHOB|nr:MULTISPECIES: cytochrome c [Salipiger]APX23854.1 Cytochrome C oxidase, cbb3-type, subunit III [Salipiger profundus]MAB06994.1 cytochrome C [Paracoccaceae bacterium]GGA18463.1 cytochrome c [Salipiger profundus]SFD27192.1 Cytochrome C oxidase, cbb3-type, subunit III [Salipiger profundus]
MTRLLIGIWAMAGLALVACVPNEMPEASDGRALYMEYCSACHGENAKGDGPMARAMTTAPKDLTLISLRHGDSFPRAKVLSTIDGYARSDLDGPGMPEFGELLQGDLVPLDTGDGKMTPTPRKLVALLEYLESIQQTR